MKKAILLCVVFACFGIVNAQEISTPLPKGDNATPISFTTQGLPTNGSNKAVVDMNNDFLDDVVSVTSTNINIFYQLPGGGFNEVNITTTPADFPASWSLAAGDFDNNGFTDLLYGAGNGVTFMQANEDGTAFTEISGPEYVFSQRSNFVDINADGHLDAFVCHDVQPNVYYINDGTGNLEFHQGGLGDYSSGGNYGSVWIDYDNDGDIDLFLAKCGGEPARRTNQMHRNNGDGTYTEVAAELNLDDPMQTWSSAWADFDNDGDMDVFVGASSGSHKLMRNNGDSTFTDVTAGSGIPALTSTGIENATYDFDNDGIPDIVSHGNILLGNGNLTFTDHNLGVLPGGNGSFGDLNGDGFIDSFGGGTIYFNVANSNNWITINTVGVQSNRNGIGARVEIETPSGSQIRDVRAGEGFGLMSTLNTHFGIGADTEILSITVIWPSGIINVINDPGINTTITIVEEELGVDDNSNSILTIYPNPVKDQIQIKSSQSLDGAIYSVFDINGKLVLSNTLRSNSIDVSSISTGNYILNIVLDGINQSQKFVKQ